MGMMSFVEMMTLCTHLHCPNIPPPITASLISVTDLGPFGKGPGGIGRSQSLMALQATVLFVGALRICFCTPFAVPTLGLLLELADEDAFALLFIHL